MTVSKDLISVAKMYGPFYCLQDYENENGVTDVSLIRVCGDDAQIFTQNNGKVWKVTESGFLLVSEITKESKVK